MTTPRPAGPAQPEVTPDGPRRGLEGWGTPALALGVVAAGTGWLGWVGAAFGLVAVVVGFVGTRRAFHDPDRSGGAALGGLVLGAVGLIWGLAVVLPGLFGAGAFGEGLTLDECMGQAQGQQQQRMCVTQHLDEYKARNPNDNSI